MPNKDGGYLLPETVDPPRIPICIEIPNDPEHIRAFWGALWELTWSKNWHNDESHTAALVSRVWSDVYRKAYDAYLNGGCGEEKCKGYTPETAFIEWFPESPYNPEPEPPHPFIYHPYTIVDNSILGTIIGQFGLGYKVGDVYTDITKIIIEPLPGDAIEAWLNLPGFIVKNITGTGIVKLHLLNIPQGGRLLIQVDGSINPLTWQLVELNKDLVSIPQETQVPFVVEVEITNGGTHEVKCTFLPTVDDAFLPIFFGGGLRSIELCGFGVTAMAGEDCCGEGNEIAYATYYQTQINYQEYLKLKDDGDTAASFDAPATFDGGEGDDAEFALCRTLNRLIGSVFRDQAMQLSETTAVMDSINQYFPTSNPISGILSKVAQTVLADHLKTLVEDCNAVRAVSCCMRDALTGQSTSIENLQNALGDCGFDFGSHEAEISAMVNKALQDKNNARAFIAAMRDDIDAAGKEGGATADDCACICCEDEIFLEDFSDTGCGITSIGNCVYMFTQSTITETVSPPVGRRYFSFHDTLGRCLKVEFADGYPYPSTGGCTTVGCCGQGDYNGDNFGGGFAPTTLISVNWWTGGDNPAPQYYKITLQDMDECT